MLSVFRNRDFTLMWLAQLTSEFGSGITSIAASILVYRETGSAASVGFMLLVTALPGLFFGLIAGVFVDRMDRKRIMVVSLALQGLLVFLIPVLLPFGIWWLYVLVMLSSTVAQFFNPAHASVLPDLATDEELATANSMLVASTYGALGLGFAAAGLITAHLPVDWAFYIDALTFWIAALLVLFMTIPKHPVEGRATVATVAINLRVGVQFIWDSPALRSMFLIFIPVFVLFGLNNALILPFADQALNATEFEYGLIEALAMAGFVAGAMMMARLGDRLREGQWIVISLVGMGFLTIVYSQISSVVVAIGLGIASAWVNVPSFVGRQLLVQRYTTREVRGRVSSAYFVARDTMFMVGMGAAGLADVIDIRVLFLIVGLLTSATGFVTLFMPGLGQPAAQWRRAISMLRGVSEAPGLAVGRSATLADLERYSSSVPALASLSARDRQRLVPSMTYAQAGAGTVVVRQGDASDAAYIILDGHAVAGRLEGDRERVLELLNSGDFFGEIAALTGVPRTANVLVDEPSTLLRVPASTLKTMAEDPALHHLFYSKLLERMDRMSMLDVPRAAAWDQRMLQELRTPGVEAKA